MGYEENKSFFEAYGFEYRTVKSYGTPPIIDHALVIDELKKRYEGKEYKPTSVKQLMNENPDLAGNIKTISNRAKETFGITLAKHLKNEGLLGESQSDNTDLDILKKRYADNPFTGTLTDLSSANPDVDLTAIKKSYQHSKFDGTFKEFLTEQGIFETPMSKEEIEKTFNPENSKLVIDSIMKELKNRYKYSFCIPKCINDIISENSDIIDESFNTHLKIAYPSYTLSKLFAENGLSGLKNSVLNDELVNLIIESFNKTNEKFVATEETVKNSFGISLDEFYNILYLGKNNRYYLWKYMSIKSKDEEIRDILNFADIIISKALKEQFSFNTIKEVKSEFTDVPISKLAFEIQISEYYSSLQSYLTAIGALAPSKYYTMLSPEDLNGKHCYIDDCFYYKELKNILSQNGAIVESTFSDKTDIVVTRDYFATNSSRNHSNTVLKCLKKSDIDNTPRLLSVRLLLEQYKIRFSKLQINVSDFNFEDLKGKNCKIIEKYDSKEKAKIKDALKSIDAKIKIAFNNKVDYYIISKNDITDLNDIYKSFLLAIEQNIDTGNPIIILGEDIIKKREAEFKNIFKKMTKEERLEYALSVYQNCLKEIEEKFRNSDYSSSACSDLSEIKAKLDKAASISDADDFLYEISKKELEDADKTYNFYRSLYKKFFTENGCFLGSYSGIETPLALGVACFVYGTQNCKVNIEWVRNKWELRGDYSSSFRYAFTISSSYPKGHIYRIAYKKYDM